VWFGLAAGMIEGFTYLLFEYAGFLSWQTELRGVDEDILWASTLLDLFVCLALACLLKTLIRPLGRHAFTVVITAMATVGFYVFLAVSGRLSEKGAFFFALGLATVVSRWFGRDTDSALRFLRKTFRPLVATSALVCLAGAMGMRLVEKIELWRLPPPPRNAPNVLLIVLDTLRADRLGCYGFTLPTTPFLDSYSRDAVLFERAFATAPWTLPSHVSFFTGYLPSAHGAIGGRYDGRFPTIAQEMARNGYATAAIVSNDSFGNRGRGFARGFIHWENGFTDIVDSAGRTALGRRFNRYFYRWFTVTGVVDHIQAPEVNRRTLRWLDSRPDRPFFLFLNYMDVHDPLVPPRKFAAKFSAQPRVISPEVTVGVVHMNDQRAKPNYPRMNEAYNASLASLDEQLGILFDGLRRRDLEKNTLVIIVSDHGESLGQHGFPGHASSVYREQIQVPLLVRFPGVTPAGVRVTSVAGLQNLPATIAEFADLPHSPFPGVSLSRWWRGTPPDDRMVVSELTPLDRVDPRKTSLSSEGWLKSLSDDHWHLILQANDNRKLFNLDSDVGEEKNLAELPESLSRVAEMKNELERLLGYHLPQEAVAKANAGP
jgi:arylsulfatase A-like enzyme